MENGVPPHFHRDDRISERDLVPNDQVLPALPVSGQEGERTVVESPADTFAFYQFLKGAWRSISGRNLGSALISTTFETSGRFTASNLGSGASTFGTAGMRIDTGTTNGSYAKLRWSHNLKGAELANSVFSCIGKISIVGTTYLAYAGWGIPAIDANTITLTESHIGFKFVCTSSLVVIHGTQGDGSSETTTGAMASFVDGDTFELIAVCNTSSVDYYCRKNSGSLTNINITATIPSGLVGNVVFQITNQNTVQQGYIDFNGAHIQRG